MWALGLTMAVAFRFSEADTMMNKQIQSLQRTPISPQSSEPVEFHMVPLSPELNACIYLANSVGVAFRSPVPRLAHWLYWSTPHSREQLRIKRELIRCNIDQSLERLESPESVPKLARAAAGKTSALSGSLPSSRNRFGQSS